MNQLRSILIICFGLALFVGNTIGLDVFEHFCNTEKTASYSYILPLYDHCADSHATSNIESCCSEEESEEGCCEDEIIHVHLDLEYSNEYSDINPSIFVGDLTYSELLSIDKVHAAEDLVFALQPNPPPLTSSERRSLHQVFIV